MRVVKPDLDANPENREERGVVSRIEVFYTVPDSRAAVLQQHLTDLELAGTIQVISMADVYVIDRPLSVPQLRGVEALLANPVTRLAASHLDDKRLFERYPGPERFTWAVEIGFLPGVTDNVGNTVRGLVEDLLQVRFGATDGVYSSQVVFFQGDLLREDVERMAR